MRQQEDFRTPGGAAKAHAAPFFDDQSALKAAPVVPLDRVARRERFAHLAGGWRDKVSSPQFRRSWPLALLLVATLAAAVVATTNIHSHDDARNAATANAATAADAPAPADAETAAAPPARGESGDSLQARGARRGRDGDAATGAAPAGNSQAFTASALGNFRGNDGDSSGEQGDEVAPGRDERGGERDRGKRRKGSKRRHGATRGGGGAILFDVIR